MIVTAGYASASLIPMTLSGTRDVCADRWTIRSAVGRSVHPQPHQRRRRHLLLPGCRRVQRNVQGTVHHLETARYATTENAGQRNWRTKQQGWINDRAGRKAVGARRLFGRSCIYSSPAIWSIIFQSCIFSAPSVTVHYSNSTVSVVSAHITWDMQLAMYKNKLYIL